VSQLSELPAVIYYAVSTQANTSYAVSTQANPNFSDHTLTHTYTPDFFEDTCCFPF